MKYCFEKYEFNNRGRIFLGYEQIHANSSLEARELLQEKVGPNIVLSEIFLEENYELLY